MDTPAPAPAGRNPEAPLRAVAVEALCQGLSLTRAAFRERFAIPDARRSGEIVDEADGEGEALEPNPNAPHRPTLLVAVSGGGDSMALATLLHRMQLRIAVAHVNYNLRGPDSDAEEALVRCWCDARGIAMHTRHIANTNAVTDGNLHANARRLRYAFFEEVCHAHPHHAAILTAHHAQDQAETVLQRLTRGAGIKGLQGIKRSKHLPGGTLLIRPLLDVEPEALARYAALLGIEYAIDASNLSDKYQRGRLRNQLFGPLEAQAHGVVSTLARLADEAAEMEGVVQFALAEWATKHQLPTLEVLAATGPPLQLSIPRAALEEHGATLLLRRYLAPWHLSDYAERMAAPPKGSAPDRFAHNGYLCIVRPTGVEIQLEIDLPSVTL